MVRTTGLFDSFDNLDQISAESIAYWIKPASQLAFLENYLANRILYPRTLSLTANDMKIDLAILREALKINGPKKSTKTNALLGDNPFLNITLRKVLIPARFTDFIPDLISLTWAFIDALLFDRKKEDYFQDIWTLVLTGDTDEIIGSLMLPQFQGLTGAIKVSMFGKSYQIKQGGITAIPCSQDRCEIAFKIQNGKMLGKNESAVEVYGGKLGLIIDGRKIL